MISLTSKESWSVKTGWLMSLSCHKTMEKNKWRLWSICTRKIERRKLRTNITHLSVVSVAKVHTLTWMGDLPCDLSLQLSPLRQLESNTLNLWSTRHSKILTITMLAVPSLKRSNSRSRINSQSLKLEICRLRCRVDQRSHERLSKEKSLTHSTILTPSKTFHSLGKILFLKLKVRQWRMTSKLKSLRAPLSPRMVKFLALLPRKIAIGIWRSDRLISSQIKWTIS